MELQQPAYLEYKERMPSPGVLALIYFLVFAAGMAFLLIGSSGASYPTPYDPVEKARHFYTEFAVSLHAQSFFLFWSSLPLGIYTAFMTARLRGLNLHRGGVNIAQFGGFGAAFFLGISGLITWIISQPGITSDPEAMRTTTVGFCHRRNRCSCFIWFVDCRDLRDGRNRQNHSPMGNVVRVSDSSGIHSFNDQPGST
jgi:hypothetical protein